MTMEKTVQQQREAIASLCEKYGVACLDLFGSATEPDRFDPARSDVDFVVEFVQLTPSDAFRRFMGLKTELEQLLKRPVDLLMMRSIRNPYLRQAIERQRVRIYERKRVEIQVVWAAATAHLPSLLMEVQTMLSHVGDQESL